jgi:ferredoxin/flavodoxin---NADP+ reductase
MGNGIRTLGYTDQHAVPQICGVSRLSSAKPGTNFQQLASLASRQGRFGYAEPYMTGFAEGRVVARRDWAPGLTTLTVDAAIEPHTPGQFVNLGLELGGELVRRSYSIASLPGAALEFYLKEVPGGILTPALLRLPVGAPVLVERKPQGFFTLDYVPPCRDLWFVATGTGLGPFISMLRGPDVWQRFERVVLVHGARYVEQLSYSDELSELTALHPSRFKRVAVVSGGAHGAALPGRVTTAFADGSLEARAELSLDPERTHLMLCGNPDMILELTALLATRGLRKHRVRTPGHISSEKYW